MGDLLRLSPAQAGAHFLMGDLLRLSPAQAGAHCETDFGD